jgi:monoamine oxidase
MSVFDADVIVVGAGIAGLTAARALAERGQRVLVLEARQRVGGRVFSRTIEGGQTVELGAEFVHGRPPELWALIEEAGAETTERDGAMLREIAPGKVEEDDDTEEDLFGPLEQLEDWKKSDIPFAEWLGAQDMEPWCKQALTGYVEGFNAADAAVIGVRSLGEQQKAETAIDGDRAWHVRGGYAQLAEYLARRVRELGGEVRLGCEVLGVRWRAEHVELETNHGTLLHAPKCVLTLPLSLLQRVNDEGGVRMAPEPSAIAQARRLAMGHVVRFTMVFRERWWLESPAVVKDAAQRLSFLFNLRGVPTVWWTPHPEREQFPTLTGWVGGPRSEALLGLSADQLGDRACQALAEVFAVDPARVRRALLATHTHNWSGDQYACGAYSYVPAGAIDAPARMTQPELETLFFAGEHTDTTSHWGTVHAAIRSGLRVAKQVLGQP